ncbi:hypothetical protein CPB84DRAFT_1845979 [Gymnopilus junonius]|uniref:Transmembrane protein n=1 Tax=Gymnopilus junonius TaxID=109634 RepID=A0A9P5NQT3_GYMJU|nr:hypothetical protein CPB84DRAFT_1845979 [Gymnopilus junonius]
MVQTTALLVDDQDPQIQYLCDSLNEQFARSYYNRTWTTLKGDDCSNGWFNYTFYGTGIHVAASVASSGASYSVKIDDGEFVPQSGKGEYTSPPLSDGKHTITYAIESPQNANFLPAFDYLAITPGSSTPLEGRTLAVDDGDDSVTYSSGWTGRPAALPSFASSPSLYENTTHWSSTIGDSLQFKFEGSSVSVLGIVTNISLGNITATYTLDGVSNVQGLPQGTLDSLPMVNLFHADVQPGVHTLVLNITEIQAHQALGVDFIAYNATSNSISSLSGGIQQSADTLSTGSKAGIAIGVLAFVALLASLFGVLHKRYTRNRNPKFRLSDGVESGFKKPFPPTTW